jgi:hypothetical protein
MDHLSSEAVTFGYCDVDMKICVIMDSPTPRISREYKSVWEVFHGRNPRTRRGNWSG